MNTAQQRIDTLRKGNFIIQVLDSNGNVVSDSISIKLKKHEFVFGCANDFEYKNYSLDPNLPSNNDWIKANILKYFNLNVTGNAYKWSGVQPNSASSYNYGPVDSVVKWADRVGLDNLKGHTLIWGAYNDSDYHSIPKWVMELPTNQAIYNACETRVRTMVSHYKGKFKDIDVLNEPTNATWLKTKLGTDSIYWNLFKWAREEDPTAKLYINEYNVEYSWGNASGYKALIKKMLSKGAPIDGIGVQAHFWFSSGVDLADLKKNMDTLATIGLPIRFTEFDLASMSQSQQAYHTANAFRFAFSHPAINGIISWGLWDAGVWRENSGYFDINKNPKLAADTIYKLVHKTWTTNITSKIIASNINFNGYYGQYDVKVKFGNTWKQFTIDCSKLYDDSIFVLKEQNSYVVRPQFVSAKLISRDRILIKFDKKMNNPLSSKRAFKIFQINPIKIDSISLYSKDSSVIAIKLAMEVNSNLITVSYLEGSLTSADGGVLEAFGPEKIDGNYVALNSASTSKDGKTVEAKFNKPMADPSTLLASFQIIVNSQTVAIDSVRLKAGNDSIMIFSLSNVVMGGDTVLFSYTAGTVASQDGHELVSFSNFNVVNIVPKFLLTSAITTTDGKTLEAKFNMPISLPTAQIANFTILVNSVSAVIDSIRLKTGNDSIILFSITPAIKVGENVKLSYTSGNMASADGYMLASFGNYPVVNIVPVLALISASTSGTKTIEALFNKPMADPSAQLSAFKITVNGTIVALDSIRLKPGNISIMVITLKNAVKAGDALQFFYTPGTVGTTDGEKLTLIRWFNVNNLLTGIETHKAVVVSFYPNPVRDYIYIQGNTRINKVIIYNPKGQTILEKNLNSVDAQINVSELPEGTYIISAFSDKMLVFESKFIKMQ
jgi:uncharacterized repeat protein (TIGR02059 family)